MMVKERFIEAYGVPLYIIGFGSSGGSMQQHLIAQNYPDLLDGIQPSLSFPDSLTLLDSCHGLPAAGRGLQGVRS